MVNVICVSKKCKTDCMKRVRLGESQKVSNFWCVHAALRIIVVVNGEEVPSQGHGCGAA